MSRDRKRTPHSWRGYAATVALVGAATAVGVVGRRQLALPDFVMLYLLTIMIAAAVFGRGPSLVAATLSVLAYDFFFIPPFFTFVVDDQRHLLTFAMTVAIGQVKVSDHHVRSERNGELAGLGTIAALGDDGQVVFYRCVSQCRAEPNPENL